MHRQRLELAITVLNEVTAGAWTPAIARYVENVPIQFNLQTWFGFAADPHGRVSHCGYAACAVGHMCLDSRFIEQGLQMDSALCPIWVLTEPTKEDRWPDNPTAWDAVTSFFEISVGQACRLFDPNQYEHPRPTPEQVVERIVALLDSSEA